MTIQVGNANARVEVADTVESRRRGLMYRQSLERDHGMLMIFSQLKQQKMWMLNTKIPLDVGFFDEKGVLLNVITMEPDGGKTTHHSSAAALYALEMNRGWFARRGIEPGAQLRLDTVVSR